MARNLTPKQTVAIKFYTDPQSETYLNAKQSILKAFNCSPSSASTMGCRIKKWLVKVKDPNPETSKITEAISKDWVIDRLKAIADSSRHESTKVRALELLGKTLAMFKEYQVTEDTPPISSSSQEDLANEFRKFIVKPSISTNLNTN